MSNLSYLIAPIDSIVGELTFRGYQDSILTNYIIHMIRRIIEIKDMDTIQQIEGFESIVAGLRIAYNVHIGEHNTPDFNKELERFIELIESSIMALKLIVK